MIEPEVAYADLDDTMDLAEAFLIFIVERVLENKMEALKSLDRDIAPLEKVAAPFPRMSYDEAAKILKEKGVEVILVSSGAIAAGIKKMGLKKRPESISEQQAVAAIGQSSLMMAYEKAFSRYGQKVAQILITRDDLNHRQRYLNARNTIFTLLSWRITPIINENDTVVVDEIKCGDNDNLSAMVTNLAGPQLS